MLIYPCHNIIIVTVSEAITHVTCSENSSGSTPSPSEMGTAVPTSTTNVTHFPDPTTTHDPPPQTITSTGKLHQD